MSSGGGIGLRGGLDARVVARGILEIGAVGVGDAKAEIGALGVELGMLRGAYIMGTKTVREFAEEHAVLLAKTKQLETGVEIAEAAIKRYGSATAAAAAWGNQFAINSRGASLAMIEFSRGLEDLSTGGFLGVLNNIPGTMQGIASAFNLSTANIAAWTAGVSIAATSAYVIYKNWDEVMELFGKSTEKGVDSIENLKKHVKELEDKKVKLSVDIRELDEANEKYKEAKDNAAAFEAARQGKTVFEKEAGDRFKKEFLGTGAAGKAAVDELKRRMADEMMAGDKPLGQLDADVAAARKAAFAARDRLAHAGSEGAQRQALRDIEAVDATLEKANRARVEFDRKQGLAEQGVGKFFKETEAGNISDERRKEFARRLVEAGENRFAAMVLGNTPQRMQDEDDKAAQEKVDDKKKKEQQKVVDEQYETAQKQAKEAAQFAIEPIMRTHGMTEFAKGVQARVPKERPGESAESQYERMKSMVEAEITKALQGKGVDLWAARDLISRAATQALAHGQTEANRELNEAQRAEKARQRLEEQQNAHRIGALNKQEEDAVKASGVGLYAQRRLAQLGAKGGMQDEFGNFHAMDKAQAEDRVRHEVAQFLHRQMGVDRAGRPVFANAGMNANETGDLAGRITAGASIDATKRFAALSGRQVSDVAKLTLIAEQLMMEYQKLEAKAMQNTQRIDTLDRRARTRNAGRRN